MAHNSQVRSGLRSLWQLLKMINEDVPQKTYEVLQETPFGEIIWVLGKAKLKSKDVSKSAEDINRMVQMWNVEHKGFKIGNGVFRITETDVKDIFGLENKGLILNLEEKAEIPKDNLLFDKYFSDCDKVSKRNIHNALGKALIGKDPEHIAILLVMELLCTFFFANTCSSISWKLAQLCVELKELKKYAWGVMVLKQMEAGLNKKKGQVSGCLSLIMYWMAEKTKICDRVQQRQTHCLRFCYWRLNEFNKKFEKMTDEELEAKMHPKEERMMEAFQEGLKSNTFFIEEAEDEGDTPTFDIWRMICKDEIKRKEKEAEENLITIIGTLEEERATQQSPIQKSKQKGSTSKQKSSSQQIISEDIMKKLLEVNETMQQQNKLWWEVMENIQADKEEYEKKIEILREKLKGKWKSCVQLEKEKSTAMMLLGRKEIEIAALKLKVEDLEMKVNERDISQDNLELDDQAFETPPSKKKKAKKTPLLDDQAFETPPSKKKKAKKTPLLDDQDFVTPPSKKKNKKTPLLCDQEFETPTSKKKKNKRIDLVDEDTNQENWKSLNEMQDMDDFMDDSRKQRKTSSPKKRMNTETGQTSRKKNKANKDKDVSLTQELEDMCAEHEASLQRDLSIGKELVIRRSPRTNKEKMQQGGIGAMTTLADATNNGVADIGKEKEAIVPRETRLNAVIQNVTKTMTTSRDAMKAMQNFNVRAKRQISPCPVVIEKRKRKSNVNTNLYTYELRNKMKKTRVQRQG